MARSIQLVFYNEFLYVRGIRNNEGKSMANNEKLPARKMENITLTKVFHEYFSV